MTETITTEQRRMRPTSDVMFREVSGEAVLLDLTKGQYYGLDEIGCRVWSLLHEGASVAAILDELVAEYDVEGSVLSADIEELIGELRAAGLVEPTSEQPAFSSGSMDGR